MPPERAALVCVCSNLQRKDALEIFKWKVLLRLESENTCRLRHAQFTQSTICYVLLTQLTRIQRVKRVGSVLELFAIQSILCILAFIDQRQDALFG